VAVTGGRRFTISIEDGNSISFIDSIGGGSGSTDLTIGGSGPAYIIESSTGSDVTIEAAGIASLSEPSANVLRITATEVDGSVTNELQTIANTSNATSHTATLSNSGGSLQLVEGSNITLTTTGTGLDGIVTIAATGGGSDDQTISLDSTVAWYTLSIESANSVSFAKPRVDTFAVANDSIRISLGGDNVAYRAADLYEFKSSTPPKVEAANPGSITFGRIHQFDLLAAPITTVCPSGAVIGTRFAVSDGAAFAATNNLTVDFTTNTQKLYGTVQNYILNVNGGYAEFIYMGAGTGWIATK
jgi:hypothetical protein